VWFRRVVPFIGSLVSDRALPHLPNPTAYLPTSAEIVHMLNHSGFAAVNHRRVMGDSPNSYSDEDVVRILRQRIATQPLNALRTVGAATAGS